ncbi:beta-xylosidase [Streptomyces resistomycificus]|uniref:Beta-xylosidase n=1 Tax=Streptomyces resistomycificus TaxID=67356 RepID=A0A0L8LRR2_9ACTN|nr:beta-xylosidase [Streptomyces resistomycificus]KOG40816.1 beta-xylosidase [Streptomyces resistomycificus]KUN99219.1 beta-xylosidase [Streptomyces resistomycificus]
MGLTVRRRRWAALLGATALSVTVGGTLAVPAGAATAQSADVDFATHCVPPPIAGIPPIDGTSTANITVDNATPQVGDTVTVTYTMVKPAANNPTAIALPADIMTPTGKVTLGGAQTGDVTVTGPKKNDPVPGNGAFPSFSMTGTFTVTAPGAITLSPGDYNIHTSYILELDTPCTVITPPAPVSETVTATDGGQTNTRAIALGSASGAPGDSVTVNGSDFTPGATVTLAGRSGGTQTADTATVTADSSGAFSGSLVVTDRTTTGVVAYEGGAWDADKGAGPAAYVVVDDTPVPDGSQKLTTTVKAGTLSMSQAGDAVRLSAVDFGEGGASEGALQTVTVKDFRGGPAGWSLTGKVTDFTGPGAKIEAGRLSWNPACATKAGSPSTCRAGSSGSVGVSGATLASTPDGTATGGEFTVDAGLSLNVPAFTPPGSYAGVLTLTLT